MEDFGKFTLIVGIGGALFTQSIDVSVATGSGGRVNNFGIMTDRPRRPAYEAARR